jgi:tRNA 5-methylaminomethyl-2-thiouridine biosynthesis bifunctional protein
VKPPHIEPCDLRLDADGVPASARYRDRFHPRAGAAEQARHVFLDGNGLPERWCGRQRFHIVETGFGLGHNFLSTWQALDAWQGRSDSLSDARSASNRPALRLTYFSIELHPPSAGQLRALLPTGDARVEQLIRAWPVRVPGLHRLCFEQGRIELLLAFGDARFWARERTGLADAFFLDGFAPDRNPELWSADLLKALTRRSRPDATAATWSVARAVREGLGAAGFEVERRPGFGTKREMLVARRRATLHPGPLDQRLQPLGDRAANARLAALETPREGDPAAGGHARDPLHGRPVLVIGAGLAGCACTHALVQAGARVTLVDRRAEPALETSGNPAGLVHGVFHHPDSPHARLHRAAALDAWREIERLAERHPLPHGRGLLRLQPDGDAAAMRLQLESATLPSEYLQVLDGAAVGEQLGLPGPWAPAWFSAGGGWVDPGALCRTWLAEASVSAPPGSSPAIDRPGWHWQGLTRVVALTPALGQWQALIETSTDGPGHDDGSAQVLGPFDAVIVSAAGSESVRLLAPHTDAATWPVQPIRGQIMAIDAGLTPGPRVAVAGQGYAVTLADGRVLVGATSQPGDDDPAPREADAADLQSIAARLGLSCTAQHRSSSQRAGIRWSTDDRLPIIGPVARPLNAPQAVGTRTDQPRFVPRVPGLLAFTALGSRGIGWAHLGAQLIVASLRGGPAALESSLLDRVDPARFRVRIARRGEAAGDRQAADPLAGVSGD